MMGGLSIPLYYGMLAERGQNSKQPAPLTALEPVHE
jgi:hypothetical protein